MTIKSLVHKDTYADSMSLMRLSATLNELPYVQQGLIGMGTTLNKQVLVDVGLMTSELQDATTRDQMLVVQCATEEECDRALAEVDVIKSSLKTTTPASAYTDAEDAFQSDPGSSLVIISVPGQYAATEAWKALKAGKNVMIFSDNVTIEEELSLKRYAHEHELLVMGPDCGTAIINNVGLCFANAVRPGNVGVVAASGTGAQEVSVQVDALGAGISQLIGVGGRDLSEDIGGIMMLDGLTMLDASDETAVIILVSKPPAPIVAKRVLDAASHASKPVVVCFIGADDAYDRRDRNVTIVENSRQAARAAVQIVSGNRTTQQRSYDLDYEAIWKRWKPGQKYIRGLFCGGTVCDEVFHVIEKDHADTYSNVAKTHGKKLATDERSHRHTLIDLGADEFTQGRAHPMIDPTLRNARIIAEAQDPETAVIILDFELGSGAHPSPVEAALPAIAQAKQVAADAGRHIEIVAYVLGTDRDPQNKKAQTELLYDARVRVVDAVVDLGEQALAMIR